MKGVVIAGAAVGLFLLVLIQGRPLAGQQPIPFRAGDLVLVGGQLFEGTSDATRSNLGILVRNGVILALGIDPDPATPASVTVHRLEETQTILLGLFDLHAHYAIDLFGEGWIDEYG